MASEVADMTRHEHTPAFIHNAEQQMPILGRYFRKVSQLACWPAYLNGELFDFFPQRHRLGFLPQSCI